MSSVPNRPSPIRLPSSLDRKLKRFRKHVWVTKIFEAIALATCVAIVGYFLVFALDRWFDTPSAVRFGALLLALAGIAFVPWGIYRWVWKRRTHPQLARLISRKLPDPGDRLLGVLDLVDDPLEQRRSPTLCRAAVEQVATDARKWQLETGAPDSRHRFFGWQAAIGLVVVMALAFIVSDAARNAWARFLAPFGDTPRYTFAALKPLPNEMVLPHGEAVPMHVGLRAESKWRPAMAAMRLNDQSNIPSELQDDRYPFEIPPQIDDGHLAIRVGDARHAIRLRPTLRPSLTDVLAEIALPEYLQRTEKLTRDVRGGAVTLVKGSRVSFHATADRDLEWATIDDESRDVQGATFSSPTSLVEASQQLQFKWQDALGLEGKQPFQITVTQVDDEPPTLSCQGISRQRILLVTEQLRFDVQVSDDFGVHRIGMEWQGYRYDGTRTKTRGEKMLAAGAPDRDVVTAVGTFQADVLGIEPQPIELRLFAEDYLPDRGRVYSPTYLLYVLSAEEHAIWLTEQLSRWHRRALEVRDRELQLYENNRQLRALSEQELDDDDVRREIARQARAESANGRRLSALTKIGDRLIQDATRNPEFGVGHLEKWAEMLQVLHDISANRMPSVADLLADAVEAPKSGAQSSPPTVGLNRSKPKPNGGPSDQANSGEKQPVIPQIVDAESQQQPLEDDGHPAAPKPAGRGRLTLPVTTLMGKPKGDDACSAQESIDSAVKEQRDLLAEFERVANELNTILANLEGSTLVKRLKAASRHQYRIAGDLADLMEPLFGEDDEELSEAKTRLTSLQKEEESNGVTVSYIMDDMQAYFERRPFARFRNVLEEMKEVDVVGSLRKLSGTIPKVQGVSMSQCEYWSDSLDRWAEDLVDPAGGGT